MFLIGKQCFKFHKNGQKAKNKTLQEIVIYYVETLIFLQSNNVTILLVSVLYLKCIDNYKLTKKCQIYVYISHK